MYYLFKLYCCHWYDIQYRYVKQRFMLYAGSHCNICGKYCKRKDRTLDHIIPKTVCYDYELFNLVLDPRNFQMLCFECNQTKRHSMLFVPAKVRQAIYKRPYKPITEVYLKFSVPRERKDTASSTVQLQPEMVI